MSFFRRPFRRPKGDSTPARALNESRQAPTIFIESVHLFVLATFAVTQPIYDRLGQRPMFLADSNVGTSAILLLTATLSLLIPAVIPAALCCVGWLSPRARAPLYAVALYFLLLLLALPIAKQVEEDYLPDWMTIGLGLCGAGGAAWAYFAFRQLRSVVTVAATGSVVFPVLFLFHSPVSSLFETPEKIETESWKPIPVVMVVFDELSLLTLENEEREIDADRFPHFAELARRSTWYRNASTVYPDTLQALPALLSGKRPVSKMIPGLADLPQNLFSLLKSTGDFEIAAFEPISKLASENERTDPTMTRSPPAQMISIVPTLARVFLVHLAPTDFQKRLPKIAPLWFGFHFGNDFDRSMRRGVFRYRWGDDRREGFEHFLDCLDDSAKPALYFLHTVLPHVPWCYLPSGRRYLEEAPQWELLDFDTHSGKLNWWGTDELYVTQSQQRYLLQLQFVDRLLGRLLARLQAAGLYDKCLLVVTADHGICFKIGEARRGVNPENFAEVMSVPLFIKMPGQQTGAVDDKNVESVDILPTIAEVLRIKLALPIDGRSIVDATLPERAQKTISQSDENRFSVTASAIEDSTVVQSLRARFGSSADPGNIYRIGPHPELLGLSTAHLLMADAPAMEMTLRRYQTRYSDDRNELVPCYFEGTVVSPRAHRGTVRIAVAVNGSIQAVTRTFEFERVSDRWTAMVPEEAFRVGENDVQFYEISGQAPDLRFTRCTVRPMPVPSKK